MKVLITDAEYPDVELERSVFAAAGVDVALGQCRSAEEIIAAATDCDALLVQYAPVSRAVFEALPRLRVVSRYGVGVDGVDLDAAREHGVFVANVPDYGVEEVAAHAFGMALALTRHLPFLDREVRKGNWGYYATGPIRRPAVLTLGLAGLGRIGRTVAERALPWFGRVVAYDPYLADESWPAEVERVELDALFTRSDILSLHLPLSEQTRGLVDGARLSRMPAGGYLVNTARGGLVDIPALLAALDDGHLAGAALDVLPQEPPPLDAAVLRHPRVLLTPHSAFYSEQAADELRRKAALNIVQWWQAGRPLYTVVEGRSGGLDE